MWRKYLLSTCVAVALAGPARAASEGGGNELDLGRTSPPTTSADPAPLPRERIYLSYEYYSRDLPVGDALNEQSAALGHVITGGYLLPYVESQPSYPDFSKIVFSSTFGRPEAAGADDKLWWLMPVKLSGLLDTLYQGPQPPALSRAAAPAPIGPVLGGTFSYLLSTSGGQWTGIKLYVAGSVDTLAGGRPADPVTVQSFVDGMARLYGGEGGLAIPLPYRLNWSESGCVPPGGAAGGDVWLVEPGPGMCPGTIRFTDLPVTDSTFDAGFKPRSVGEWGTWLALRSCDEYLKSIPAFATCP